MPFNDFQIFKSGTLTNVSKQWLVSIPMGEGKVVVFPKSLIKYIEILLFFRKGNGAIGDYDSLSNSFRVVSPIPLTTVS